MSLAFLFSIGGLPLLAYVANTRKQCAHNSMEPIELPGRYWLQRPDSSRL